MLRPLISLLTGGLLAVYAAPGAQAATTIEMGTLAQQDSTRGKEFVSSARLQALPQSVKDAIKGPG